ncbi:unnamed protein product, partial [Phaeothamnion confervicola]
AAAGVATSLSCSFEARFKIPPDIQPGQDLVKLCRFLFDAADPCSGVLPDLHGNLLITLVLLPLRFSLAAQASDSLAFNGAMWKLVFYPLGYRAAIRAGFASAYLECLGQQKGDARDGTGAGSGPGELAFSVALLGRDGGDAGGRRRRLQPIVQRACEGHDFALRPRWGFMKFASNRHLLDCTGPGGAINLLVTMVSLGANTASASSEDGGRGPTHKRSWFGWWPNGRGRPRRHLTEAASAASSVSDGGSGSSGGGGG